MKVLIADDHPLIRSAMKLLLESDGHDVVAEADNGADAVQLARKHNVDLIILDITMPGLDGLEVINRIRVSEVKSRILVVTSQSPLGGLKEQVQQSVNFSEHANHETGHSRLRNIVTTWRLNEPSLPD